MEKNVKGLIYTIASSIFVSLNFVLTSIILRDVNPETSAIYFFGFGTLTSFILLLAIKRIGKLNLFKKYWKILLLLGVLEAVTSLMWFYSIEMVGPSTAGFLLRFVIIFTVFWGVLFLKEKFNLGEAFGMIIAIAGAFVITYYSGQFILLKSLFVIATAFLFSVIQLIIKLYVKKIDSFVLNHYRMMSAFLLILIYSLFTARVQSPTSTALSLSFLGAALGGVLGAGLFYKSLELWELSKVNVIRSMDPFVIVIFSFLILQHDIPASNQLVGGLIVVLGIIILALSRRKPKIVSEDGVID